MKFMNFVNSFKYCAPEGDALTGGAPATITSEMVAKMVADAVDSATSGLKTKNDDLLKDIKAKNEHLAKFEGIDPDKFKQIFANISASEEAKLLSEGKVDEVLNRRTDKMRADSEAKEGEYKKQLGEYQGKVSDLQQKLNNKQLADAFRDECIKQDVLPEAYDNVIRDAMEMFRVMEDDAIEARDKNGNLIKTKEDYILTPERFVHGLQATKAFYFKGSVGGGSGGTRQLTKDNALARMNAAIAGPDGKMDMVAYRKAKAEYQGKK